MKSIEIKKQVPLSLGKCVELVLSGVRFRLFRAAVTVTIIALAATFLMTMMVQSMIARRVARVIHAQTADRREFDFWISRLSTPLTEARLTAELAEFADDKPRRQEFKTWGAVTDDQLAKLIAVAGRQLDYEAYFDSLDVAQRRPLIGPLRGAEIFADLQSPPALAAFNAELKNVTRQMPQPDAFPAFLADWNQTEPLRQAILQGHRRAVAKLKDSLFAGRQAPEVLNDADANAMRQITEAGFRLDAPTLQRLRVQASYTVAVNRLTRLASVTRLKRELNDERLHVKIASVDVPQLFSEAASSSGAHWLAAAVDRLKARLHELQAAASGGTGLQPVPALGPEDASILSSAAIIDQFNLSPQRIEEIANYKRSQEQLAAVEAAVRQATGKAGAAAGFSGRTLWLLVVSFVVCIVGIANAMLMSVTERFREIATMKCLGATDGFIMINFILESVMQGIAGGLVGVLLGALLGLLSAWASYGVVVAEDFPLTEVAAIAGVSFAVGVTVSALAAVYPALVAARLAPMEAMRIE